MVDAVLRDDKGEYFQSSKDNAVYILKSLFPDDDEGSDTPHAQRVRKEVTTYLLRSDTSESPPVTPSEVVKAFEEISPFQAVPDDIIPYLI